MDKRKKILFVVSEFYQAGTERFTYELDRALDKQKFEIIILSLLPLNQSERYMDYYYPLHLSLGTKIYFLDDLKSVSYTISQRIKNKLGIQKLIQPEDQVHQFLRDFEWISIMGEYNFNSFKKYLLPEHLSKLLIHIQNSKNQSPNLYDGFEKNSSYHFVSGFHPDALKFELNEFSAYQHTYYNLNFAFPENLEKKFITNQQEHKIGIFTRLTSHKPIDPFLYSFADLLSLEPNSTLHIYGSGDPEKEGVMRYIRQLKIETKVFFHGHQENIQKAALQDELDLVWLFGYHGLPGGWAGFDMCAIRMPQLFWDFSQNYTYDNNLDTIFPMFNSPIDLARASEKIIGDPDAARVLANKQFNYTNENYNIKNNIAVMENLYSSQP